MHRRAFLFSAAALLVVPVAAFAGEGPVAFLTAIYRRVAAGKGNSGGAFMLGPKDRPDYFSPSLCALWAAAAARSRPGHGGPVDFDPIANSRAPRVKAFAVKVARMHATAAAVAVSLADQPGPVEPTPANTLHYVLVKIGGRWLIDDISGSAAGATWDLRDDLKRFAG